MSAPLSLTRLHTRRLRDVHRSAGWPCLDAVEVELLAAGLLERRAGPGAETLRLTDAGLRVLAESLQRNRAALGTHEALVERTAREMARDGRIVWRGLSLRAQVEGQWMVARPDVFSVRHTTVEAYLHPVVHEIKVSRADLLGELRRPAKGQAYREMAGECWYVLGCQARGEPIAEADEIGADFGVMLWRRERFEVLRQAPRRPTRLPFGTWMALARATPAELPLDEAQALLGEASAPDGAGAGAAVRPVDEGPAAAGADAHLGAAGAAAGTDSITDAIADARLAATGADARLAAARADAGPDTRRVPEPPPA